MTFGHDVEKVSIDEQGRRSRHSPVRPQARVLLGLAGSLAPLLSACSLLGNETGNDTLSIQTFEVSPLGVTAGQQTTFLWDVHGAEGATCALDVDGDDAADYVPDCKLGTQRHTYLSAASYNAILTVSNAKIKVSKAVRVNIEADNDGPGSSTLNKITWQSITSSPIARHEGFGTFAADGKFYVFGGYSNIRVNRFKPTREVSAYDPQTDTWERKRDMPEGVSHAGIATDGTTIYYAGGYPEAKNPLGQTFYTRNVWMYDIRTDSYAELPPLPKGYGGGGLALVSGTLHYFGGSGSKRQDSTEHWTLSLSDPHVWQPAAGLPTPRNHLGSAVIDGNIYAVGGQSGQDARAIYRTDVHRYDPDTDTWTHVKDLPKALSHNNGSTFVMEGRLIVLGGEPSYGKSIDSAFAYDPKQNTWEELTPMPLPKGAGVGGYLNGKLYHFTGSNSSDAFVGVPTE